ncbi:MAG: hypothetical protein QXG39_08595 [Candidatus Aenigmatarchaeota archaeon]
MKVLWISKEVRRLLRIIDHKSDKAVRKALNELFKGGVVVDPPIEHSQPLHQLRLNDETWDQLMKAKYILQYKSANSLLLDACVVFLLKHGVCRECVEIIAKLED